MKRNHAVHRQAGTGSGCILKETIYWFCRRARWRSTNSRWPLDLKSQSLLEGSRTLRCIENNSRDCASNGG